jgi:hypothetical protein
VDDRSPGGECPHCGERVESVAAFDRHLAERHGLRSPDASPPSEPKRLGCGGFAVALGAGLITIFALFLGLAGLGYDSTASFGPGVGLFILSLGSIVAFLVGIWLPHSKLSEWFRQPNAKISVGAGCLTIVVLLPVTGAILAGMGLDTPQLLRLVMVIVVGAAVAYVMSRWLRRRST